MDPGNRWGGSVCHVQDGAMSNDSSAAIRQERLDRMAKHREKYLQSGGTQGAWCWGSGLEDQVDAAAVETSLAVRQLGRVGDVERQARDVAMEASTRSTR